MNELLLFAIALTLHFLVNDFALRQHHQRAYDEIGRWVLAAAVWFGFMAAILLALSAAVLALLFSFLAGGIILNVLKEELPEERQGRFSAFVFGASAYAVLLLAAN